MSIAAAHSRSFTIDDLEQFPDDGHRYELIEGTLLVTAAPSLLHQLMCVRFVDLLVAACPAGLVPLPGPAEVIAGISLFQPDVLVVRADDINKPRGQAAPPLLVIEVQSPSTRLVDQGTKRLAYREAGVGAYWMGDPHEPRVTVLRWDGDGEVEESVVGEDVLEVDRPAPLRIQPSTLVGLTR